MEDVDHKSAYSVTPLSLASEELKSWEEVYVRRQPPAC